MQPENIKEIRKKLGLTQRELAEKIGVSLKTITNYETGGVIPDTKRKILASLNGKSIKKNEVTPVPEDDYIMVEFEDLETAAGKLGGGDIKALPENKKRLVPKEYAKGFCIVVRVHGESMNDQTYRSILNGDEILIKQCFECIENLPIRSKLFVIVTREGSVVKQIKEIDKDNKTITCHSFNPTWEDYKIPFDSVLQIFTVEKKVKSNIFF